MNSASPELKQNSGKKNAFSNQGKSPDHDAGDDIEEDIVQDMDNLDLNQNSARNQIEQSATSANAIDMSIDTLRMNEYDYVEEVRHTP